MSETSRSRRSSSSESFDVYEWVATKTSKNGNVSQKEDEEAFSVMLNRIASSSKDSSSERTSASCKDRLSRPSWKKLDVADPINNPEIHKRFINLPQKEEVMPPDHHVGKLDYSIQPVHELISIGSSKMVKDIEERYVTGDDINFFVTQMMKAEFAGNKEKVAKLKVRLDKLREAKRRNIKVRLTRLVPMTLKSTTSAGRDRPLRLTEAAGPSSGRKHKQVNYHDDKGSRVKFLCDDDDSGTIEDMVRREKLQSKNSYEKQFVTLASRCKGGADDEYDDVFSSKRVKSRDLVRQSMKSDAIAEYKRKGYAESKCASCLSRIPRFLVISVGQYIFLSVPEHVSLTRGHCVLTPVEHAGAMTRTAEGAVKEAAELKRALCRLAPAWHGPGASCVFTEVAAYPGSFAHHVTIECFPVDRHTLQELPSYFKKSLTDLGSEWDQNKRIVTLKRPGEGARDAIPPNFGYFAVEFGIDGAGYAKVIEDWANFPLHFGREILGGILGKSLDRWRKPKKDSLEELRRKTVDFEEKWASLSKFHRESDGRSPRIRGNEDMKPEGPEPPPSMT